jgi:hypothetical protein
MIEGPSRSRKPKAETSGADILPEEEKLKVVLVNVDELAEEAAHDAAERHLTASKESMRGFSGFFKKMWQHGMAREYYRQKQLSRSRLAIAQNEDLYAAEQDPRIEKTAHQEAMHAIVDRFASEYEETIHEGESKKTLSKEGNEAEMKTRAAITGLIRDFAAGTLTEENFNEARTRVLGEISRSRADAKSKGLYADNLLEVARQAKLSVAHGKSLDDLDAQLDIKLGNAKNAIKTKANYNAADKIIEKLKKSPVGIFVNEGTLATGVAVALSVGTLFSKRALTSKVATALTFGGSALVAGAFTGFAENKRLKEDRRQHAREMAQGRTYEKGISPRREEMEAFVHETKEARVLAHALREQLYGKGTELKDLSQSERQAVIGQLADIEARIQLGDRESIDLLAYSGPTTIERERFDLDIARAQAKADMRKLLGKEPLEGKKFDELLALATEARIEALTKGEGGIAERNKLFDKMKAKKVAGAAIKGVAAGLVIGSVVQEVGAFFDKTETGFFERLVKGDESRIGATRSSPPEALRALFENHLPPGEAATHLVSVGPTGQVKLPEGMNLTPSEHGFQLTQNGKVLVDGLTVTPAGGFDPESLDQLKHHGLLATASVGNVVHTATANVSPHEFMQKHPELGHHVKRDLWFDNDTPKPVFDKNELKLWWGGEHNVGVDAQGRYTFTMDHMTKGGSYHDGLSVHAKELAQEGKLRMLLSVSQDTQAHPIEVPIDADGKVHIDPNSETGKLLFQNVNGKAHFLGRFAEVAEVTGSNADGTDHVRILATYEGKGLSEIPDTVKTTVSETTTIIKPPEDYRIDPPPIIPVFGRRPLEPVNGMRGPNAFVPIGGAYYYGGGRPLSMEQRKAYEDRFSPALRKDPDAKLDARTEINRYLEGQEAGYRERIEALATQTEPMSPDCKISICIPVAGHQEAANIERTLSSYLNQTSAPSSFEVVLFVNQPDVDKSGVKINSDGTLKKIEAFKKEHPEFPVRVMQAVLPRSEARIGLIRKLLNDATLARSNAREGGGDVILVSNDADTRGVAPEYIENFEKRFEKEKQTDAFMGQLDWDPESYVRNPLVHIGTRLMQYMELQVRQAGKGISSSGANFAFRSSIYAAIGGYSPEAGLAEDVDLGRRIQLARLGSNRTPTAFAGARVSRLYTSSRRAEKAVRDGLSPSEQWEKGFSAFDDEVRKTRWEDTGKAPDYNDAAVVEKLTEELEVILNRTLAVTDSWYGGDGAMTRRALGWLGVKYKLVGPNRIKITDASQLIEGLKTYQKEGMEIMERKTAKPDSHEPKQQSTRSL